MSLVSSDPLGPAAADGELELLRASRLGIGLMVGAMACFVFNDALVKYASQTMPAAQLIFVRGLMAVAWILLVARASGASMRIGDLGRGRVALRSTLDALATFAYLLSLFRMPIGNAIAINMASPLFITLLAIVLLRERVGLGQWLAIAAGFAGVLLLVRPATDGFNEFALLCLLGALLHALRDLVTRGIPQSVASITVTLSTATAVTLLAGGATAVQGWEPFGLFEFGLLAGASVFLAGGYYLMIRSTRTGNLSAVAPFRYSALLIARALGWIVWNEAPDPVGWTGIAVLLLAGVYLLRRPAAIPARPRLGGTA